MKTWKKNLHLPFRVTELSARRLCGALGMAGLVCLSGVVGGCGQRTGGSTAPNSHPDPAEPVPGIVATRPEHIPPDTIACAPSLTGEGRATLASVSDAAAPRITISVPDGWSSAAGTGDTALTLTGPARMSATVTITPTDLQPDSAFSRYTASLGGSMPRLNFSVAGAPFCGFSSELLTGTLQGPSGGIDFADRITHIRTNTLQYLVAIHVEGPVAAAGFRAAKSTLTQNFAVVIP